MLALVVGFFALPFLTVGCDTPGGFGRVSAGGTTSYRGFQLAFGLDPTRSPADHVLPVGQGVDDRLGLQPLVILALALVVAALVASVVVSTPRVRRALGCGLSGAALIAVVVAVLVVRTRLIDRVADQLHDREVPADRTAASYVVWGNGFTLAAVVLAAVALVDLYLLLGGYARRHRPPGPTEPTRPGPPAPSVPPASPGPSGV